MLQSIGWGVRWLILPSPVHPYIHTYIGKEWGSKTGYDKYNKNCKEWGSKTGYDKYNKNCKREQKDIVMMNYSKSRRNKDFTRQRQKHQQILK